MRTSSEELEFPWLDMWSISCCWEGKGSVKTQGVGLVFKNWVICSRRGHSFMKWSPPCTRHGYFSFLFPLSFSLMVGFGFSCWFPGFLFLALPFFLLLQGIWVLWMELTSAETLGVEGVGVSLGLLGKFCCRWGLDWTNNPINRGFCWWLSRIGAWARSLRDQVIQHSRLGIYQVQILG